MRDVKLIATVGMVAGMSLLILGCAGPRIVETGEPPATTRASATPPPPPPQPDARYLVNNFDYAAKYAGGNTAYFFASPSGRWQCAIVPRVTAGCQTTGQAALGVTGAPAAVAGADGTATRPNAIEIPREGEPRFSAVVGPGFVRSDAAAVVLPFNRVLSVAGFRCNVQEATGVSCMSDKGSRGFTVDAAGFTWQYADVPADAP